jgi:hypothetical protein
MVNIMSLVLKIKQIRRIKLESPKNISRSDGNEYYKNFYYIVKENPEIIKIDPMWENFLDPDVF